jgi:hypothetical protein
MSSSADIEALEGWLDCRGIPRKEKECPWEEEQELKLSDRVLRVVRDATNKAYAEEENYRSAAIDRAVTRAAVECVYYIWLTNQELAQKLACFMGVTPDLLDNRIAADEDSAEADEESTR